MKNKKHFSIKLAIICMSAGICMIIAGTLLGAKERIGFSHYPDNWLIRVRNQENKRKNQSISVVGSTGIRKLSLDIDGGKVEIKRGSQFSISGDDAMYDYVEEDTWYIEEKEQEVELFGGLFQFGYLLNIWDNGNNCVITVPEDFQAEWILAEIGAGKIECDWLAATEGCELSVGAGKITVNSADVHNLNAECGAGKITLQGKVEGKSSIDCDVGKIELYLDGKAEEYQIRGEADVGKIEVDGKKLSDISLDNSSEKRGSLDLNVDVGKIEVEFE